MLLSLLSLSFASGEDYAYNPIGKRDPFRPVLVQHPPPDPVVGWSLKATAADGQASWALLEGPDGTSAVLETGDYLPGSWAKVRSIGSEELLLEEEYLDVYGELVVVPLRLRLPEPSSR